MGVGVAAHAHAEAGYVQFLNPERTWLKNKRLILLHAWLVLFLATSANNGYDGSLMNSFQSLQLWKSYFGYPHGGKLGLLNAIQNIGSLAAYPFAPICPTALVEDNLSMFIAARFFIGFGLTFAANSAPSMYNSLWYLVTSAHHGLHTVPNTSTTTGHGVSPRCCRVSPHSSSSSSSLCSRVPRWLVYKGKEQQALHTLAYYHADGDETDPLVLFEYNEIKAAVALDLEVAQNVGWSSLIATPGNRKRMIIIIAIASSPNGPETVLFVLPEPGVRYSRHNRRNYSAFDHWYPRYMELFWALGASIAVERIGRRTLFIGSCAGMLLFFTLQTICSAQYALHGSDGAAHAVIAFIFLFYAATSEFSLRAKGFNVFNFVISVALIFNQYVNPIALGNIGWKYYIVYCCWIAFELVFCYFFIVETRGLSLEETAALFDGEEATRAVTTAHEIRHDEVDDKTSGELKA
ncbi:hypothetical protein BC629DRAFT_1596147 [Irpex lacteus]|nr:hypothetical protein BC629DRAFT_1596147 [Irpex lacteus]